MFDDYRNTKYCNTLCNIHNDKKKLNDIIYKKYLKEIVVYDKLKSKSSKYNSDFIKIYNGKCSYCGASINHVTITNMEVDHYIHEKHFNEDRIEAGKIENLVLSCYSCNRSKQAFFIENEYKDILHPDNESITEIFYRDENFYIKVKEEYLEDEFISLFYERLKLGYQVRRVDFLLLSIDGLKTVTEDINKRNILLKMKDILLTKRNNTSLSSGDFK